MVSVIGQQTLGRLQRYAESRMRDTCVVSRAVDGSGDLDSVTGLPAAGSRSTVYSGPCRVHTGGAVSAGAQRQSGADTVVQVSSILHVPVGAPRVQVNDVVRVTASENPALPSMTFVVSGVIPGSQMTAQRVQVTTVID